jgi:DNA-binding CsgD family transcriptional regulator
MRGFTDYIVSKMPLGAIAFDSKMDLVFSNAFADLFIKRYGIPVELSSICRNILDSIKNGRLKELYPGEIYLSSKLDGSSSRWTFKFDICEISEPLVYIFFKEESVADKLDLNELRRKFRFTRREMDVLRRVLSGLKNTEVAEELNISEQTVKEYLQNVYAKIGVRNKFELVSSILTRSKVSTAKRAGKLNLKNIQKLNV